MALDDYEKMLDRARAVLPEKTLTFERFEGFGLRAAQPPAVLIVIVAFVVFLAVRTILLPRRGRSRKESP